jgi:hypothetical protein
MSGIRLNRTMLQQIDANSGALGMLGAIVHAPRQAGDYSGTVYRDEQAVGEFSLRVTDDGPLQVHVDLAAQGLHGGSGRLGRSRVDDPCCDDAGSDGTGAQTYTVGRQGHAVFHVSSGSGYSVQLAALGTKEGHADVKTWDSRELQEGDLFAITLLRPGAYRFENEVARAEGDVRLAYPQRGKIAYRPPDALRVAVTQAGFEPHHVELQPVQGLVYEIHAGARITISLTEPDDGPQKPDEPPRARYTLLRRPAARDDGTPERGAPQG